MSVLPSLSFDVYLFFWGYAKIEIQTCFLWYSQCFDWTVSCTTNLLLGHFSDFCLSLSLALNGRGYVRDLLVGGLRDSIEQFLIYYIFLIFSCYSSLGPKREHFSGHLTPEGTFIYLEDPYPYFSRPTTLRMGSYSYLVLITQSWWVIFAKESMLKAQSKSYKSTGL